MFEKRHPIKVVAARSGLSAHVIRVWERRYDTVTPARTGTNRRLYSDEDIEHLILLQKATSLGESIGQIARLPNSELVRLLEAYRDRQAAAAPSSISLSAPLSPRQYVEICLGFVTSLDARGLESALMKASVSLSQMSLLEQVLEPLMYRVGDLWSEGSLKIAHEHLASAVVRSFLGSLATAYEIREAAPVLIVTTPVGHRHEFGALIVTIRAAAAGWQAVYLGPNLPADEIAAAALDRNARAVAISLVYPGDEPRVVLELKRLRRLLNADVALL
ncbi:MAG: MerR family transcriptional regulator, partial [candidate division Zixibacteria bacterium]|nr:MerR family transcriptional regulator [candidate division Zixibacteria bacterium]